MVEIYTVAPAVKVQDFSPHASCPTQGRAESQERSSPGSHGHAQGVYDAVAQYTMQFSTTPDTFGNDTSNTTEEYFVAGPRDT